MFIKHFITELLELINLKIFDLKNIVTNWKSKFFDVYEVGKFRDAIK